VNHRILLFVSLVLLIGSITYSIIGLFHFNEFSQSVVPSSLVYLSIGLLAICITFELKTHTQQITQLREELATKKSEQPSKAAKEEESKA